MSSMRVLQAMAGAEFGGAEAFFTRLVIGLAKSNLDQRVLIRPNSGREQALKKAGIDPVLLKFGGRFDLFTPLAIRNQLRDYRPNIVLTWMNRATAKMPKKKLADVDYVHVARLGGYYDLKYYRHCDHLIGNTHDIVDYLIKEGWPKDRAHYLPNFVAADVTPPILRKELHVPDSAKLIMAFGRLHENKGFDVLIRALALIPDAYLCIAGEGPEREALENIALKEGVRPRTRFLGWREDTAALLGASDVFVCPSRHEPLGNVVIESWAQSCPVVAASSQGPTQLINDGENGLLVPVDDHDAMAVAIKRVLTEGDLRNKISANGRASYEADFTEHSVIKQYLDFFQMVGS
ncbi:MAG: glycosyltransferase [Rhodospirillaceae bacterium]|nr:glycosyltransferase [Rhodospirillaceae bacterium]